MAEDLFRTHGILRLRVAPAFARGDTPLRMTAILMVHPAPEITPACCIPRDDHAFEDFPQAASASRTAPVHSNGSNVRRCLCNGRGHGMSALRGRRCRKDGSQSWQW